MHYIGRSKGGYPSPISFIFMQFFANERFFPKHSIGTPLSKKSWISHCIVNPDRELTQWGYANLIFGKIVAKTCMKTRMHSSRMHTAHSLLYWSLSRESLSRSICLGVSVWGSLFRGCLLDGVCPRGSLSRSLCSAGLCPVGVQFTSHLFQCSPAVWGASAIHSH